MVWEIWIRKILHIFSGSGFKLLFLDLESDPKLSDLSLKIGMSHLLRKMLQSLSGQRQT